eukprot:INCI15019.2.p1 GENE.INCI15019.2~~INCI15019.2.p1  ORF type:complete len:838 (+),score=117.03 INCI15019.2:61-2514(+)
MVNILRTVVPAVGAAAGLASAARVGGLHGAAHRRQNDVASGSIGALQIGSLCQFSEAYADHGTGSAMDLSMFQPDDHCESSKQREWYEIGHFGMSGYHLPGDCGVVVSSLNDATHLAVPIGLTMNWVDEHDHRIKGSRGGGLFTAVCPAGFVALGSVALYRDDILTTNVTVSDFPRLRCVAKDFAKPVPAADLKLLWDDHGSRIDFSGSVWSTEVTFNQSGSVISMPSVAGQSTSYSAPSDAWTLDPSMVELLAAPFHSCNPPEQVHTAFGHSPDTLAVQWSTMGELPPDPPHLLQWGEDTAFSFGGNVTSTAVAFTADAGRVWFNHVASMTQLKPSSKYFYRVGSDSDGWSETFSITSQVTKETLAAHLPQYHVIFGDMGSACAFTLCPACTCGLVCDALTCASNTTVGLVSEVEKASMMLHVGDFGYNLDTNGGTVGDQFMRNIEQVAARVPYMVSIGNHEDGDTPLAHFTERFRLMPANGSPNVTNTSNGVAPNNWYFSWNDGLVHYVAISTEAWFGVGGGVGQVDLAQQYEWLKADLEAANANRHAVPWIVVHGHRSMYCSCDADCDEDAETIRTGTYGLEELFMDQGVDLFLNGHEHNYERNWPTYRGNSTQSNVEPTAPIYIVTGAAGCTELHEPFTRPQPPRSAFRSNNFGYSRFIVHNESHARWQQVIMDPGNVKTGISFFGPDLPPMGSVIDDTWIVQSNHGPFNRTLAPSSPGECKPETCKTLDHWGELFSGAMRSAARKIRQTLRATNMSSAALGVAKLGIGAGTPRVRFLAGCLNSKFSPKSLNHTLPDFLACSCCFRRTIFRPV